MIEWFAAVATVGAAWGGAKAALNGTRKRVERIEEGLESHTQADAEVQTDIITRLAVIESKVDDLRSR